MMRNSGRSSAAEYLTFVAATGGEVENIEVRYEDENIWLSQKMMAKVYGVDVRTISEHIQKILSDGELIEEAVIRKFRITADDGKRYNTKHYNLQMIIAVGFKVNNMRAVQFRKWANGIVKDYTIQGWVMDVDRLKNGHKFTDEYFERQLQLIREIRLSERRFYQKVTDIFATAFDYDKDAQTTRQFFQMVQNKMHYAVHRHTAAELIYERADAGKENMGLMTWDQYPDGRIVKADVLVAKNYLSDKEMKFLERLVSMYLDYAELQAERKIPMSMEDWAKRLDGFLEFNGNEVLTGAGKISAERAKLHAETEFEKFRVIQDYNYESDFDRFWKRQEKCLMVNNEIVGRAELKLAGAVETFGYDFRGKTVLDIGSSTGGFTELALRKGAAKVIAIEKGTRQMKVPLRYDSRVELHEKTDVFTLNSENIDLSAVRTVVADVSFVSLRKVLAHACRLVPRETDYLVMLKPQFEAFPDQLVNGVVKNEKMRREIMKRFEQWLMRNGFRIVKKAG